ERLVDRIVDDFVDQVMKALGSRRADVHGGPLAHGFEAFEDLNAAGVVGAGNRLGGAGRVGHACSSSQGVNVPKRRAFRDPILYPMAGGHVTPGGRPQGGPSSRRTVSSET